MQDGVPDCIEALGKAGVKVWVLTGDKLETAMSVSVSCKLLTLSMGIKKRGEFVLVFYFFCNRIRDPKRNFKNWVTKKIGQISHQIWIGQFRESLVPPRYRISFELHVAWRWCRYACSLLVTISTPPVLSNHYCCSTSSRRKWKISANSRRKFVRHVTRSRSTLPIPTVCKGC